MSSSKATAKTNLTTPETPTTHNLSRTRKREVLVNTSQNSARNNLSLTERNISFASDMASTPKRSARQRERNCRTSINNDENKTPNCDKNPSSKSKRTPKTSEKEQNRHIEVLKETICSQDTPKG